MRKLFAILIILLAVFGCGGDGNDIDRIANATLAWDANEPAPAGYMLYYKTNSPGPPYDGRWASEGDSPITIELAELNDSNNPEYIINDLSVTEVYFFVVTAYDFNNNESGYSNEVFYP